MEKAKIAVFILLLLILGNLFIIDIALFWNKDAKTTSSISVSSPEKTINLTPTVSPNDDCSDNCKNEIKKAVDLALLKTPVSKATTTNSTKESFITLGSGSSTADSWSDIPGAQSYIDSTAYGTIKTVTFEVSLHTPTGNQTAYARLYNVTDSHPVWNSDVTIEGGTPQLKISSPIKLDTGSKLYQVQMRTQLTSRTNLENARVHIISN